MASTAVLLECKENQVESHGAAPDRGGLNVGWGFLWIVGVVLACNGVFIAFNYLMGRLLG